MERIPVDRVISKLDELLSKNDYAAAKEHLLYWLGEAEKMQDNRGALLLNNELMGLSRKLGEKENALKFVNNALQLIDKMNIANNVGAATTYLNSATVYKAFGKAQDGIDLFCKAKDIYEKNLAANDDRIAGLYNNMALSYVDLCRFDEADELYKKAIAVLSKINGKEPEQAITYLNMASAAEAQFGLEDAEGKITECLNKAMELLDISEYQNDGNYAFVCEKCASVFGYYGYFFYENELKERSRRIYERS
ncbi:MAG: tetratricopeptide repeat protein [Clostridia bacterium]|nr:tetratricopeptide repeat protein [Clostridia bacterium]